MLRQTGLFFLVAGLLTSPPTATAETDDDSVSPLAPDEASSDELTLAEWLAAFRATDPLQRDAAVRHSIASLTTEQSRNPQGIDLTVQAGADGGMWAWASGADPLALGGVELSAASVSGRDARGRRWEVNGSGRLGVGSTLLDGHSVAVGGAFYGSLSGNHEGRLHQLESSYLALDETAVASREEDLARQRCWLSADLYLLAWNLQEQIAVVDELLQTRERNRAQTERDHRRGMVTRLDFLSAQSDLLKGQRRRQALAGRLEAALASLASFMDTPPATLADPRPTLSSLLPPGEGVDATLLESHPSIGAYGHTRAARLAQSQWVEQRYKPHLELGPQIQFSTLSHQLDPSLQETQSVNLTGGVAMQLSLPVSAPTRHYEQSILQEQAELAQAGEDEARRALTERRDRAQATLRSTAARTSLVAEQLELIDAQVSEAWKRFLNGRLEYQDYLLHYTQYEEARLGALQLELHSLQARIELAELTAELPEMCR